MENQVLPNEALQQKVPMWKKVGYCFGGMTDTLVYDFAAIFLLFFMTDLAGINPAFAGTIITIGVLWDMITDPIVGNIADRIHSRLGKKRTMLAIAIIPILGSYMLLFTNFESMTGGAKNAYFVIMSLMFWLSYTLFSIPYYSMGASLTGDNDERTKIRMLGQIIQYVGVFISNSAPTMMVTFFISKGMSDYNAWHYTAWIEAFLAALTLTIVFLCTKDTELEFTKKEKSEEPKTNFFKDAIDVLKIKPYLLMTLASLAYRVGYCLVATCMTYFILYSCGLSMMAMSAFTALISFGGIVIIAGLMRAVNKFDKVKLYAYLQFVTAAAMIIFNFIHIGSLPLLLFMGVLYLFGSAAYWSLNIPIMYDSIEVDEFQCGKRREGTMLSFYLFVQKGGYAIAASVVGWVLAGTGYDDTLGAMNPQPVLDAIQNMYCAGSGIFFAISGLIVLLYPLKKGVYDKLYVQLENKRAGKEYNTEGFEKVLNKKYR